jgi:large subunit ribosomal protein L15
MRMNTIKPATGSKRAATRVGRGMGSGLGKTAGRGHKGQFARTGKGKVKPGFEGGQMPLQRRLPKIGFRSKTARDTEQVMLYQLDAVKGNDIDLAALLAANVISPRAKSAKIVLKGEIKRAVSLKGILVTAGAKAAIEAAGGKVAE